MSIDGRLWEKTQILQKNYNGNVLCTFIVRKINVKRLDFIQVFFINYMIAKCNLHVYIDNTRQDKLFIYVSP